MLAKDVGFIISTDDLLPDDLRAKQRPARTEADDVRDLKKATERVQPEEHD